MNILFKEKQYSWSLFIGHLVIEKLLKAFFVHNVGSSHPNMHDLVRIAEKSNLELNEEQRKFFATVTTFNINARYDDYKSEFYKICTKKFTESWINEIMNYRKWIKDTLLNR